jgi:hypothetical protein
MTKKPEVYLPGDKLRCIKWGPFLTVGAIYEVLEEVVGDDFLYVRSAQYPKFRFYGPRPRYFERVEHEEV